MSYRLCVAILITACTMPAWAIAQTAVRYAPSRLQVEREKMSPAARRDAIIADLDAMADTGIEWNKIATKPYLSKMGGLCRRDVITLSYAGRKPVGILYRELQYHFLGEKESRTPSEWQKACERLSGEKDSWADSNDAGNDYSNDKNAYNAFVVLQIAIANFRANKDVKLDCDQIAEKPQDFNCGQEFLKVANDVSGIGRCEDRMEYCYGYGLGDYGVMITEDRSNNGYKVIIRLERNDDIIIT